MTALNHALTGAVIGLAVSNPLAALVLAFVSHFVLDVIPHYDFPGDELTRIRSKGFIYFQIIGNAILCGILVLVLAVVQPHDWVLAAACAFMATSPDMLKISKFIHAKRDNVLIRTNWVNRFHHAIQWKYGPDLWWTEAIWCLAMSIVLGRQL